MIRSKSVETTLLIKISFYVHANEGQTWHPFWRITQLHYINAQIRYNI